MRVRPAVASRVLPAAGAQLRLSDLPNPGHENFGDRFAQSGLFGSARVFEITKLAGDKERFQTRPKPGISRDISLPLDNRQDRCAASEPFSRVSIASCVSRGHGWSLFQSTPIVAFSELFENGAPVPNLFR